MKSVNLLLCTVLFGLLHVHAQSSENSAGGNASGSSGNVAYSIGDVFYEPVSSAGGQLYPGVQGAYEVVETLGQDIAEIGLSLKVFPNPTTDILNLRVDLQDHQKYSYELSDFAGRVLAKKAVTGKVTQLSVSGYPAGHYLLKVLKNNAPVKIFKVIKTDK